MNSLGGADFEIIPTKNICLLTIYEQAHFVFPHVLAAPSVAGQPDQQCWEQSGQSRGIKTRQACSVLIPRVGPLRFQHCVFFFEQFQILVPFVLLIFNLYAHCFFIFLHICLSSNCLTVLFQCRFYVNVSGSFPLCYTIFSHHFFYSIFCRFFPFIFVPHLFSTISNGYVFVLEQAETEKIGEKKGLDKIIRVDSGWLRVACGGSPPIAARPAPLRSWNRCRWSWWWRLLAIICLHCLPRLASFGKTGTSFGTRN